MVRTVQLLNYELQGWLVYALWASYLCQLTALAMKFWCVLCSPQEHYNLYAALTESFRTMSLEHFRHPFHELCNEWNAFCYMKRGSLWRTYSNTHGFIEYLLWVTIWVYHYFVSHYFTCVENHNNRSSSRCKPHTGVILSTTCGRTQVYVKVDYYLSKVMTRRSRI